MDKTKWHSKLVNLAIVVALVFLVVGVGMPQAGPVLASPDAQLTANITAPDDGSCVPVGNTYNITANVTNTGDENATNVEASVAFPGNIALVAGANPQTVNGGTLAVNETGTVTWTVNCTGSGTSLITVTPAGQADGELIGDIIDDTIWVHQYDPFIVSCNATPNPTKICHNVTFTFNATGGVPPYSWNWTYGDGNSTAGTNVTEGQTVTTSHHYATSDNFTAVITLTDSYCGNTASCNQTIEVFPRLTANCIATPDSTKVCGLVCHNVTFNGTGVGGLPFPDACDAYNWTWEFGDGNSQSGNGYTSGNVTNCYNATNNYTAIFTIWDNCLSNNATCNVTVEVPPPLKAHLVVGLDVRSDCGRTEVNVCQNFTTTATVENTGNEAALNVTPTLTISPPTGANCTGLETASANITPGETVTFNWTCHCEERGDVEISVNVTGTDNCTAEAIPEENIELPLAVNMTQELKAHLTVTILSPGPDTYIATCQDFAVTAKIQNTGEADALNVTATIDPGPNASLVAGDNPKLWDRIAGGFPLGTGESRIMTWTLHCDEPGAANITVTPAGIDENTCEAIIDDNLDSGNVIVEQYPAAHLVVDITEFPEEPVTVCETFNVTANITNTGWADAWEVSATISVFPEGSARVAAGDVGYTQYIGTLAGYGQNGTAEVTWTLHCKVACDSTITITASGYDEYGYQFDQETTWFEGETWIDGYVEAQIRGEAEIDGFVEGYIEAGAGFMDAYILLEGADVYLNGFIDTTGGGVMGYFQGDIDGCGMVYYCGDFEGYIDGQWVDDFVCSSGSGHAEGHFDGIINTMGGGLWGNIDGHFVGDLEGLYTGSIIGTVKYGEEEHGSKDVRFVGDFDGTLDGWYDGEISTDGMGDFDGCLEGYYTGWIYGTYYDNEYVDTCLYVSSMDGYFTGNIDGDFVGYVDGYYKGAVDSTEFSGYLYGDYVKVVGPEPTGGMMDAIIDFESADIYVDGFFDSSEGGSVDGTFDGDIHGYVDGAINGWFDGIIVDTYFVGPYAGSFSAYVDGSFNGTIIGDFTGNMDGDFTGDALGEFTGYIIGDVFYGQEHGSKDVCYQGYFNGDLWGWYEGTLDGDVNAGLCGWFDGLGYTGFIYSGWTGPVTGYYRGNIYGSFDGDLDGCYKGTMYDTDFSGYFSGHYLKVPAEFVGEIHGYVSVDAYVEAIVSGYVYCQGWLYELTQTMNPGAPILDRFIEPDSVTVKQEGPYLTVEVSAPEEVTEGDTYIVTAVVTNTGEGDADNVTADIQIEGDARLVDTITGIANATIGTGDSAKAEWRLECTGGEDVNIAVSAEGDNTNIAIASVAVKQIPINPYLTVVVSAPDEVTEGDTYIVTAVVTNEGLEDATGVNATIQIAGNATMLDVVTAISDATIAAGDQAKAEWRLECTGGEDVNIAVTAVGNNTNTAVGSVAVIQIPINPYLTVVVSAPAEVTEGDTYIVTAVVTNEGLEDATGVNATIQIEGDAALAANQSGLATISDDTILAGDQAKAEWRLQCTGGEDVNIAVTAEGTNTNIAIGSVAVIQITVVPSVTVYRPNGGETFAGGSLETIIWSATDDATPPADLTIDLYYSTDGGSNWLSIATTDNDGAYKWSVPTDIDSSQCLVKVEAEDAVGNVGFDTSDNEFTIVTDAIAPTVTVISPNGGEVYAGGSVQTINWTATDDVTIPANLTINLYLSSDGGMNWAIIATGQANDGSYTWTVPTINSSQCLVKVTASDAAGNVGSDMSNSVFTIDSTVPLVTVYRPNGGEEFAGGSRETITWSASDPVGVQAGFGLSQSNLTIVLYYSTNGGGSWTSINTTDNDGAYKWDVPSIKSCQCLVRVEAIDSAGNRGFDVSDDEFCITIACVPVTSFNITLYAGWNFISLPLIPDDSDIAVVISAATLASGNISNIGLVYWYDCEAETYLVCNPGVGGDLTTMEDGKGYWVSVVTADVLTVTGSAWPAPPAAPPTYELCEGWNPIGFKSTQAMASQLYLSNLVNLISGLPEYSILWGYDAEAQQYFNVYPIGEHGGNMEPGHAYWIWMKTEAGTIVPPAC